MDELKHFSHNHALVRHQVPQSSELQCSGCKSTCSGNIYACWQCHYFLHEQCYGAPRSLKHPSHPLHPLTLVAFPTYPSASFVCNACNHSGHGFSYSCSSCEFDIHVHCALMPNPNTNLHSSLNPISHTQNPIYPSPIQTSAFPAYPQTPTIPQNYPSQPISHRYPIVPDNPSPNVNTSLPPNQHNPYPFGYPHQNPTPPPPQQPNSNQPNPPLGYPQQNPTQPPPPQPNSNQPNPSLGYPQQNPTQPPPPQPNPTIPTYSTVVNTTTSNPPSSMKRHFSHPHLLTEMEIDQSKRKICSACEADLLGLAYCCTEPYCTFALHRSCFDSPSEIHHKSHPNHPLTLVTAPSYGGGFTCDACLKVGRAFAYNCSTCSYDIHINCSKRPETVTRPDHKHPLTLLYSASSVMMPGMMFMCDVCKSVVDEKAWVYYCRECDFGTHVECVSSTVKQGSGGNSAAIAKTEAECIAELEETYAALRIQALGRKYALELLDI